MGATLTSMQAGSLSYRWALGIEGYSALLTNASEMETAGGLVIDAWTGYDFTSVLSGLFVTLENNQSISPWEPFGSGGSLTFRVTPDAADTFGIALAKKIHTGETVLDASIDTNDTTITVKDTSTFASSGAAYIGTEAFTYSGKTSTTFTGVTRGVSTPFGTSSGTRFGQAHRVAIDPNGVNLQPKVTSSPRVWENRWVGLWMHGAAGADSKGEAQLVYAGRIVEYRDEPSGSSMHTTVDVEHVLDYIQKATLGRDMWTAKIAPGIKLIDGMTLAVMQDLNDTNVGGTPAKESDPLVVVASGAVPPKEINAGTYSVDELCSKLNSWLAEEKDNARIHGEYSFAKNGGSPERTNINWKIPGGDGIVRWSFIAERALVRLLGFTPDSWIGNRAVIEGIGADDIDYVRQSGGSPMRWVLTEGNTGPDGLPQLTIEDERGTFEDQFTSLPQSCPVPSSDGLEWGIFLVAGKFCLFGAKVGTELVRLSTPSVGYAGEIPGEPFVSLTEIDSSVDGPPIEIRQIFVIDTTFAELMLKVFYSTGTAGYNESTYDVLPRSISLGIPGSILGPHFLNSIVALPSSNAREVMIIDKPKKLVDVFRGSLVVRWAFLRWKDQHLEFGTWKTPSTALAIGSLTDANKSASSSTKDNHRTATTHTDQWTRPIVRWEYDRNLTNNSPVSGFRSDVTFENSTAVDDAGGNAPTLTIQLPNIAEKPVVDALAQSFIPLFSLFSSGNEILQRSIDPRYWEGYSVGDVLLVTDGSARDPNTGRRGVASRPGIITRHRYSPGGRNDPASMESSGPNGEVELLLLPVNRIGVYVPCADVDDTAGGAGYNAGTKALTCYAHHYSESSEAADASHFLATYQVRIIERDPADPELPLFWDDTVASQTGNTITLTTGLAGYNTALKYRVVWVDYTDAEGLQQANTFQADDADNLIQDERQPFEYGYGQISVGPFTANSSSDPVELIPNLSFGDGVGRDVGHDAALNHTITKHIDYNAAHSAPYLHYGISVGELSGTWILFEARPFFVHGLGIANGTYRTLSVAPFFRSESGASVSVRVTVARAYPGGQTIHDIDRGSIYRDATFTTSSTTWATATPVDIDLRGLPDGFGGVFILLELTADAQTRGLAVCQVSARIAG